MVNATALLSFIPIKNATAHCLRKQAKRSHCICYQCLIMPDAQAYFSSSVVLNMNRLPIEKRVQIVTMLVEGMSMRSVSRVADVSINTVTKLLADVGAACSEYQDKTMRNLALTDI